MAEIPDARKYEKVGRLNSASSSRHFIPWLIGGIVVLVLLMVFL
jgi:hypothetical protein